jgi:ribosomal protein L3 glutamine methyltransferase
MPRKASDLRTVRELVLWAERRFKRAGIAFGHGTLNAREEAVLLVFHAAGLRYDCPEAMLDRPLPREVIAAARGFVDRRIAERRPAAYIVKHMWFAGLDFYVDERVIVPRSPLAELIEARFAPWIAPDRVARILDIGAGSGCIAIACAAAFEHARVDATDVSPAALEVARLNVAKHGVAGRVRLIEADVFPKHRRRYDVIISNPPYVPSGEIDELPPEYRAEPRIALAGGADGLDIVRRLLREATDWLAPGGLLIVEVGEGQAAVEGAYSSLPFVWLELERSAGDGGVFLLTREDLMARAHHET